MATNLKTRVEKLEQATTPADPPAWVKVLMATFGGTAEDYMPGGQVMRLEDLVASANEPDTSGRIRTE